MIFSAIGIPFPAWGKQKIVGPVWPCVARVTAGTARAVCWFSCKRLRETWFEREELCGCYGLHFLDFGEGRYSGDGMDDGST